MIKFSLFFFVVLSISIHSFSEADQKASTSNIPQGTYSAFELSNGIEGLVHSVPSKEEYSVDVIVDVGYLKDKEFYTGAAHFVEHLVHRGSREFPELAGISGFLTLRGGSHSATTGPTITRYNLKVQPKAVEEAMARFAGMLYQPIMADQAIKEEISSINNEWLVAKNNAGNLVNNVMLNSIVGRVNGEARLFSGNESQLSEMSYSKLRRESKKFIESYYCAGNIKIVFSGPLDATSLRGMLEKYFSPIPGACKSVEGHASSRKISGPTEINISPLSEGGRPRFYLGLFSRLPKTYSELVHSEFIKYLFQGGEFISALDDVNPNGSIAASSTKSNLSDRDVYLLSFAVNDSSEPLTYASAVFSYLDYLHGLDERKVRDVFLKFLDSLKNKNRSSVPEFFYQYASLVKAYEPTPEFSIASFRSLIGDFDIDRSVFMYYSMGDINAPFEPLKFFNASTNSNVMPFFKKKLLLDRKADWVWSSEVVNQTDKSDSLISAYYVELGSGVRIWRATSIFSGDQGYLKLRLRPKSVWSSPSEIILTQVLQQSLRRKFFSLMGGRSSRDQKLDIALTTRFGIEFSFWGDIKQQPNFFGAILKGMLDAEFSEREFMESLSAYRSWRSSLLMASVDQQANDFFIKAVNGYAWPDEVYLEALDKITYEDFVDHYKYILKNSLFEVYSVGDYPMPLLAGIDAMLGKFRGAIGNGVRNGDLGSENISKAESKSFWAPSSSGNSVYIKHTVFEGVDDNQQMQLSLLSELYGLYLLDLFRSKDQSAYEIVSSTGAILGQYFWVVEINSPLLKSNAIRSRIDSSSFEEYLSEVTDDLFLHLKRKNSSRYSATPSDFVSDALNRVKDISNGRLMPNYNLIMIDVLNRITIGNIKILYEKIHAGHEAVEIEFKTDSF